MVHLPRKRYEYEKARVLRHKGFSYSEIRKELNLSKSTISLWCRDIQLSDKHKKRLLLRSQSMFYELGAMANKVKRDKEIAIIVEQSREEIREMSLEEFKIAGAMLYWAEGTKTQGAAISNSDPRIIKFTVNWLNVIFGIGPERLKAHLHIHYGNDEKKIIRFWSRLTNIPLKNFGKSFIKPQGTGHRTNIIPNGVIKIRVLGPGGENLRHRILAWADKTYFLSDKFTVPSSIGRASRS